MTVRVYSDQAGTTAATANDNIGKVEDLSKFDSDGVSSTTGPYLSVDANGFGSADILAQGGDVVQTFTNAIADGSALVVGTSKCIFFSNVNVEAGGTLTIGPAGDMINTNGLNLVGKVVSVATTTKVLTTAEQNSIATFFAQRGASSVVVNDETVYDVNSVEADVVLDFTGDSFYRNVPHYFKLGGTYTTFADAFMGTSPKLTYSTAAGSNSTMVNSAGEIVWAPHNLLTYSEDFTSTAWEQAFVDSVDSNVAIAPDGTQTADLLHATNGSSTNSYVYYAPPPDLSSQHTCRVWAKKSSDYNWFRITFDTAAECSGWFNLQTGAKGTETNGTASISDAGNGWWLCTWTATKDSSTNIILGLTDADGATTANNTGGTASMYLWGAHLYRSDLGGMHPVPGAATGFEYYVPTNGSAEYLPRVGHHVYNGSTWVNEGLLIESEARSNVVYPSEFPTSAVGLWAAPNGSTAAVDQTGPDGLTSATTLTASTTGTERRWRITTTQSNSTTYTLSFYAKAGSSAYIYVRNIAVSGNPSVDAVWWDVSDFSVASTGTGITAAGSQPVGNGWYRCYMTATTAASPANDLVDIGIADTAGALSGTSGETGIFYGFQLEAGSTPSSYMPTSGGTYTRTAQSLTVPPAEFGWPEPEYIGPELVTASPDLIDGDWTNNGDGSYSRDGTQTSTTNVTFNNAFSANKTYIVTAQVTGRTQGQWWVYFGGVDFATGGQISTNGSHTYYYTPTTAGSGSIIISGDDGFDGTLDISVREINPLSVSIQMDGRMTYADDVTDGELVRPYRWHIDNNNRIRSRLSVVSGSDTGNWLFQQTDAATNDEVATGSNTYTPGVLVPFNISSRHGSTFVNGAVDGVALTADTTPTALPDLSSTNLQIAQDFMGTIGTFRQFAGDIGDTGLVTATKPSTEPTLSLTFDGTNGSFYNLNWSE